MSTAVFLWLLHMYCVSNGSCVVGLVSTGQNSMQSGKQTVHQCSGDSSDDVAVSAIPIFTSDLPQTVMPCPTWPSSSFLHCEIVYLLLILYFMF